MSSKEHLGEVVNDWADAIANWSWDMEIAEHMNCSELQVLLDVMMVGGQGAAARHIAEIHFDTEAAQGEDCTCKQATA